MNETFEDLYASHVAAIGRLQALEKVFLLGCPKSGTTWLMNLLHGHPEMAVCGEGSFTWRLGPVVLQAFKAFNEGRRQDLTFLREHDQMIALRSIFDGRFLRYWLESKPDRKRIRFVGDKTPQHTQSIPLLHALYPRARFVHIVRDPRDAAASALFHIAKNDPRSPDEYVRYFLSTVWPLNVGAAWRDGRALSKQFLHVRYEDLLADEPSQVRRILRFLGAADDEQCVAACIEAGSFANRSGGRSPGQENRESFYRIGIAGDWVNHLSPDIAAECCRTIAPLMREFGYEPDAAPRPMHTSMAS